MNSLENVVDEILVLDSGSRDQTQQICEEHPLVRFISQPWLGFGPQKQKAVELASHDIILSLDADEALSKELAQNILQLKEKEFPQKTVFEFNRLNYFCHSWIYHCDWYPDRQKRLFNRHECFWPSKVIHESLETPPENKLKHLGGDILHYTYNSISEHIAKMNPYTDLSAQEIIHKGQKGLKFKIVLNPLFRFIKMYIIKRGFLDGLAGFQICFLSAVAVFLKYSKALEILKNK